MSKLLIAGRFEPEFKTRFTDTAEAAGMSQQGLLEQILYEHFEERAEPGAENFLNASPEDDDRFDEDGSAGEEQDALSMLYPVELSQELNFLLVEAWEDVSDEASSPIADFLLQLGDSLIANAVDAPWQDDELEPEDHYTEVLPDEALAVAEDLLTRTAHNLSLEFDKEAIFTLIARAAYHKSEQLYSRDRRVKLTFTRSEWAGLDKLLQKANQRRKEPLGLADLIRIKLGEVMEEMGEGFFGPTDKQLYEVGKRMQVV